MAIKKVCVIGLDGASPVLINKWIDDLPAFQQFRDEGLWGYSIPPLPAQTPVAWTTFMTGQNPGKHGIFSFIQREVGSYQRRIASPSAIKSETLWQILSAHGKRVGVLNVPMSSYEHINGFMIPGFLDHQEGVPQPAWLRRDIAMRFHKQTIPGDLETEVLAEARSNPTRLLNRIDEITDLNAEVSLHLLEQESWDFFMTVFMGTDRVGHFFWKYADPSHPMFLKHDFSSRVKRYYERIDSILQRFLKRVPPQTLVILVSDHGFCPVSREVFLNNYLQQLGCLQVHEGKIDVAASQAVAYGYGDIWLNVAGREPSGVVRQGAEYNRVRDRIIQFLEVLQIEDHNPIQKVVKREEVYWGSYLTEAADLIAIFHHQWQAARRPEIAQHSESGGYYNPNPLWSGGHDGTHNPQDVPGILGFLGSNVNTRLPFKHAYLRDLAPTILSLLGVPVPREMDGTILPLIK
jgi:predicted AlkP superfamily phosphohydrolase/phosphomutase